MKIKATLLLLLLTTGNSFSQWTQQVSNTNSDLNDVFFLNDSLGFAVGNNGVFLKTLNNGQSWSKTIIDPTQNLLTVIAVNTNTIFSGSDTGIYKSTDSGAAWNLINDDFNVVQLVFFSPMIGYAKSLWLEECESSQGHSSGIRYKYYKTTDGGQTWASTNQLDNNLSCGQIEYLNSNVGYLAGHHIDFDGGIHCEEYYSAVISKTTDGGVTWFEPSSQGPGREYTQSSFISESTGYFIDDYGSAKLWKTTDGGLSLNYITQLQELPARLAFANEFEGYYIRNYFISKTTTEGLVWTVDHANDNSLRDIEITEGFQAFVVGNNGIILHNALYPVTEPDSLYWLSPDKLYIGFPLTPVNGESRNTLTLRSSGNMDIIVSLTAPPEFRIKTKDDLVFHTHIDSLLIKALSDTVIDIAFLPLSAENYLENLEIQTNAFNDTTMFISLAGRAKSSLEGIISEDTFICGDTLLITGNIKVNEGAKLTICAGTTLLLQGYYSFEINGSLRALGEPENHIRFTSEDVNEGWQGIRIAGTGNDSTILQYSRIEYGNAWGNNDRQGGGINITDNDKVLVTHCEIYGCAVKTTGGGINISASNATIQFCEIWQNRANEKGAGIYCEYANPQLKNNIIHHNFCDDRGGGIYTLYASPILMNNNIYSNTADFGGGIFIDRENDEKPSSLIQNLIFNNTAYRGGGIYLNQGKSNFFQNTICNNSAWSPDGGGGIKTLNEMPSVFQGNIFYGNLNGQIINDLENIILSYCNIQGGWNGAGVDNIDADPGFLNPTNSAGLIDSDAGIDWSFPVSSPSYNKGIPDTTGLSLPQFDFAGNPRIYNGRMDIGALESFFFHPLTDQSVCLGESFSFTVAPAGDGPYSFYWMQDDEAIPEADSIMLYKEIASLDDTGYYQCRLTSPEGIFFSNKAFLSVENDLPWIFDQPEGGQVKEGESFTLAVLAENARTFQWYLNDSLLEGESDSQLVILNFSAELQGNYRCYIENVCGGVFSEAAFLVIDHSGIDEERFCRLKIYPNPAFEQLTVDSRQLAVGSWQSSVVSRQSDVRLEIVDVFGVSLMRFENVSSLPFQIDISALKPGIYFIRILDNAGINFSKKILKLNH